MKTTKTNRRSVKSSGSVLRQCAGIDVSKDKISCAFGILSCDFTQHILSVKEFVNNAAGFKQLIAWANKFLSPDTELWYNMEAAGVYHEEAAYCLSLENKKVSVVLPSRAKQYAKSLEIKSKTDKIDAKMLATMGLERTLTEWKRPDEFMYKLKRMTRERLTLRRDLTVVKNRLHALTHRAVKNPEEEERLNLYICFLQSQKETVENSIREHINTRPAIAGKIKRIETAQGLGFIAIVSVISETDGFSQISSARQSVGYAGLDVRLQESGIWKGQCKVSKKGNSNLRTAVYMPSMSAAIHNRHLKSQYERVKERTGNGKKALMPVARKLLVLVYVLWKSEKEYDPYYIHPSNMKKQRDGGKTDNRVNRETEILCLVGQI